MNPITRSQRTIQNDQAIETRRVARAIANREPELNSIPTGVPWSDANVPTERSDYSRLRLLTVWVLIAVLIVLGCGAFYVLWSKVSGG